jgi:hypothetical protein
MCSNPRRRPVATASEPQDSALGCRYPPCSRFTVGTIPYQADWPSGVEC